MSDKAIDNYEKIEYNADRLEIIARMKSLAIMLSKQYRSKLKIEIGVNGQMESASINLTEYL